ncbi:hypothetical protein V8F20_012829 [Naviculisporaceae sp. PSN 640]
MQLTVRSLFGLLACLTSQYVLAFELTLYPDVAACSAESDTTYRIITGPSNGSCYNLDQNPNEMELVSCAQYENGGANGPLACSNNAIVPRSIRQKNEPLPCEFYSDRDCQGGLHQIGGERPCLTATDVGFENYQSFKCSWDDSVDILGEVGCANGVSTNVCVNDCACKCLEGGQRMVCAQNPDVLVRCNEKAIANCQLNCVCINP